MTSVKGERNGAMGRAFVRRARSSPEFDFADLRELALADVVRRQLVLFLGTGFADEDRDFVAQEFAAKFGFAACDGAVALRGTLGKAFEQIRRDSSQLKTVLAAFDGVAEVSNFAGEGIAVNLGEVAGAFKDVRRLQGEQPGA